MPGPTRPPTIKPPKICATALPRISKTSTRPLRSRQQAPEPKDNFQIQIADLRLQISDCNSIALTLIQPPPGFNLKSEICNLQFEIGFSSVIMVPSARHLH